MMPVLSRKRDERVVLAPDTNEEILSAQVLDAVGGWSDEAGARESRLDTAHPSP